MEGDKPKFWDVFNTLFNKPKQQYTSIRQDQPIDEDEKKANQMLLILALVIGSGLTAFVLYTVVKSK